MPKAKDGSNWTRKTNVKKEPHYQWVSDRWYKDENGKVFMKGATYKKKKEVDGNRI